MHNITILSAHYTHLVRACKALKQNKKVFCHAFVYSKTPFELHGDCRHLFPQKSGVYRPGWDWPFSSSITMKSTAGETTYSS